MTKLKQIEMTKTKIQDSMIMKMKKLKKNQRGFTLIELIIVIGLTGIITAGITLTIMQVFNMDARTRNDMIAVYQVRQAGKLVSEDILEAKTVTTGVSSGFPLTLTQIKIVGATNYTHTVIYTLVDMSGGLKKLQRSESINGGVPTVTPVAEYIDPDQTKTRCDWDNVNKILTFKVTATVGEQTETRTYEVKPRPGS
ncbi:MAG: type II secretion system GspH family protein [Dehalococcoidia bacterium]|nr:type II secretion system GspH family protein [Dehalococcoidia bacterium]